MKKLIKKLRSECGETLVETIAAILVFTFASIILLSMIATATKLNGEARVFDKRMHDELYIAESQDPDNADDGSLTIRYTVSTPTGTKTFSSSLPVDVFSAEDGALYSFTVK